MSATTDSLPVADPMQFHRSAAARGELRMQACLACGRLRFPPSRHCPDCAGDRFEWRLLSGNGTIWSFCVFHKDYYPGVARRPPYAVTLVQLDEGPRLYANLLDTAPQAIRIGMRVRAAFETQPDGSGLVQFRLA